MLNPDLFTIEQSKQLGTWPPSDIVVHGIFPYVKRLKEENLRILDVGVMKGENAYHMLALDEKNKIKKIYGVVSYSDEKKEEFSEYETILKKNMENQTRFSMEYTNQHCNVVCIHAHSDLYNNLNKYYKILKHNGIFCGNEHNLTHVKEALVKFRRETKIGTPIMVSNGCWFWIKR
jgi:SAM-dependent methyltransferase